jgi:hypothetical protein
MKNHTIILLAILLAGFSVSAQSFSGTYSIGKTVFKVKPLSIKDDEAGLFNIVYSKGNKVGTMASTTEDPKFEFVFLEHEGDIYRGTFYFTKAWKGKPLAGYYIPAKSKKKLVVKFIKE